MNQPNPAQQRRNRIIAAIQEQQRDLQRVSQQNEMLAQQNIALRDGLAALAVAAGVGSHPRFASLVKAAGLQMTADPDTNNRDSIGGTPATSTEEAKRPDATDDVNSVGAVPGSANKGVTPAATTDVNDSDVAINPPVLDNLQNVTQPTPGTDAVVPAAGDAAGTSQVQVGTPSNDSFDPPGSGGWTTSSKGSETERFTASLRLARLQIQAGLEQGEDLAIAQKIAGTEQPLGEILAQASTLSAVVSAKTASAPNAEQQRRLVPTRAPRQGIAPVASAPSLQTVAAVSDRPDEDAWLVGGLDL